MSKHITKTNCVTVKNTISYKELKHASWMMGT